MIAEKHTGSDATMRARAIDALRKMADLIESGALPVPELIAIDEQYHTSDLHPEPGAANNWLSERAFALAKLAPVLQENSTHNVTLRATLGPIEWECWASRDRLGLPRQQISAPDFVKERAQ